MTQWSDVEKGDLGTVRGRAGVFMVTAGAPPPRNVVPCSQSAVAASEQSETLRVWNAENGESACPRGDFARIGT